jgi:hypothetical protein
MFSIINDAFQTSLIIAIIDGEKIDGNRTRSLFDMNNIVNKADLKNARERVSKAHEETKETVEQSQNGNSVLNLAMR